MVRKHDGSGSEFLTKEDVLPFIQTAKTNANTTITEEKINENVSTLVFLTKQKPKSQLIKPKTKIPSAVLPVTPDPLKQQNVVHYRRLVRFRELPPELREKVRAGLEQWKSWYKQREEHSKSISEEIKDPRTDEEIAKEKELSERIKRELAASAQFSAAINGGDLDNTHEEEDHPEISPEQQEYLEKILSPNKEYMQSSENVHTRISYFDQEGKTAYEQLEREFGDLKKPIPKRERITKPVYVNAKTMGKTRFSDNVKQ